MSNLTKEQRESMKDSEFAVPSKRKLPMHDENHTRLAWDMVERTKDLTPDERRIAKERILKRAKELGMDTENWTVTASIRFEAMAIEMPRMEHPNRMPFTGILTRVDQPSDAPPHGSTGKRTLIPSSVAESALPSLLGMAVDFTPNLDGHDRQAKIGLITEANVEGDALHIAGFFYASDFPEECSRIQAEKDALGFSYECQARIRDLEADIWEVDYCIFTGAAVLYKDLAAYQTTSLQAKAESNTQEISQMDMKELMEAINGLQAGIETLNKDVTELKANGTANLSANKAKEMVAVHCAGLRACADNMEAAGIGLHAERGHVKVLRHMAARMEAEAALGNVPHIYRDHDYVFDSAADKQHKADDKAMGELMAAVGDLGTKLADLQAKAFAEAKEPERKTFSPEIKSLLAKAGIDEAAATEGKVTVDTVDKFLDAAGIKGVKAIETKLKLRQAGVLPAGK